MKRVLKQRIIGASAVLVLISACNTNHTTRVQSTVFEDSQN